MDIDRRIASGLAVSLVGHGLLAWLLLPWPQRAPVTRALALHVELTTAPDPALPPVLSPPVPQPVEAVPPPSRISPAPDTATNTHDWQRTGADVVAAMSARPQSLLAPIPSGRSARHDEAASRFPAVGEAFGPMPRSRKICGRMVTFELGAHRISMPVAYGCEDKKEEFRTAPAAGRNIGDAVQQ